MIPEVVILIFIIFNLDKLLIKRNILLLFSIIIIPLFWIPTVINLNEFFLTYISTIFYFIFILVISSLKKVDISPVKSFILGQNVNIIFGLIQFTVTLFTNSFTDYIHVPFGEFTFSYTGFSRFNGIPRTNALFYEPSIFGVFCLIGFALCIYYKEKIHPLNKYLCLMGILISFSASSILGLVLILLVNIPRSKGGRILYLFVNLSILYFLISSLLIQRLNEFGQEGTSGYYRIIAPIYLIKELIIKEYPFGIAFGQITPYLMKYNFIFMQQGGKAGMSVDNIPMVLILNFGVLSIFIFLYVILILIKNISVRALPIFISFTTLLFATGAFNFIYFCSTISLFLLIRKFKKEDKNDLLYQ